MTDLELRVKEMKERPRAFAALKDLVNNTQFFHRSLANLTGEGKVFTQTEVDTLAKLIEETKVRDACLLVGMWSCDWLSLLPEQKYHA